MLHRDSASNADTQCGIVADSIRASNAAKYRYCRCMCVLQHLHVCMYASMSICLYARLSSHLSVYTHTSNKRAMNAYAYACRHLSCTRTGLPACQYATHTRARLHQHTNTNVHPSYARAETKTRVQTLTCDHVSSDECKVFLPAQAHTADLTEQPNMSLSTVSRT